MAANALGARPTRRLQHKTRETHTHTQAVKRSLSHRSTKSKLQAFPLSLAQIHPKSFGGCVVVVVVVVLWSLLLLLLLLLSQLIL